MKIYFTLLLFFLFSLLSYGQDSQWSTPVPVSDSISDNRNVTLSSMRDFYNLASALFMCWENSVDSNSTAILGRMLFPDLLPPFVIASQPNVHFKHPRISKTVDGDTLFSVYFETNMNGNWDIYYVNYLNDLTVSPMIPVQTSPADETGFFSAAYLSSPPVNDYCWISNGNLYVHQFSSGTAKLDSGEISNAMVDPTDTYWLKDSLVWQSKWQTNAWSTPVSMANAPCRHLSFGNDSYVDGPLMFEQKRSGYWRLMATYGTIPPDSITDFTPGNNIFPSSCTVYIITNSDKSNPRNFNNIWPMTFASDQNGNMDIYASNLNLGNYNYVQLSTYSGTDTHPQLFNYFSWDVNHLFDIWESYRNGHWQLWMATADITTGINNPKPSDDIHIAINPNPFSTNTDIEYQLSVESVISVVINNILGEQVITLKGPDREPAGIHHLKWNGTNNAGIKLAPGVYLCTVAVNGKTIQRKMILK